MNIPKYSLENKKVIYFFLAIMLIGGVLAFFKLPKKEDSPFVIKQAVLMTQYPGADPLEVEKLVTEPIEREIQSMSDVFQIKSESYFGMSKITIELDPTIPPENMPVKWDELRRKVSNIQPKLPSGASSISVSDDFGDVFGIYYALTADDGFSFREMRDWAQKIKTELTPIDGVQKVFLYGEQTEVVNVSISVPKLANLGIDPNMIQQTLQTQNLLVNTGEITTGAYQLRVRTEGTYNSIDDIRNQLIVTKNGKRKAVDKLLFPGYVLIQAELSAKLENIIRNMVPGMSGFLTEKKSANGAQFERIPVPLRDEEVQRILGNQDENADSAAETVVNYSVGESVSITGGPFSGFTGVVDEILEDRSKIKVIVEIFGRKTQVELSFTQVTKVTKA